MLILVLKSEVLKFFLDMLEALDKVWHEGLIYKLRQVGISGEAHSGELLINRFLNNRFQSVILNGQSSHWLLGKVGAPQGSTLCCLFSQYILMIYQKKLPSQSNSLQSNPFFCCE